MLGWHNQTELCQFIIRRYAVFQERLTDRTAEHDHLLLLVFLLWRFHPFVGQPISLHKESARVTLVHLELEAGPVPPPRESRGTSAGCGRGLTESASLNFAIYDPRPKVSPESCNTYDGTTSYTNS